MTSVMVMSTVWPEMLLKVNKQFYTEYEKAAYERTTVVLQMRDSMAAMTPLPMILSLARLLC